MNKHDFSSEYLKLLLNQQSVLIHNNDNNTSKINNINDLYKFIYNKNLNHTFYTHVSAKCICFEVSSKKSHNYKSFTSIDNYWDYDKETFDETIILFHDYAIYEKGTTVSLDEYSCGYSMKCPYILYPCIFSVDWTMMQIITVNVICCNLLFNNKCCEKLICTGMHDIVSNIVSSIIYCGPYMMLKSFLCSHDTTIQRKCSCIPNFNFCIVCATQSTFDNILSDEQYLPVLGSCCNNISPSRDSFVCTPSGNWACVNTYNVELEFDITNVISILNKKIDMIDISKLSQTQRENIKMLKRNISYVDINELSG
jgi:hypothetical protein